MISPFVIIGITHRRQFEGRDPFPGVPERSARSLLQKEKPRRLSSLLGESAFVAFPAFMAIHHPGHSAPAVFSFFRKRRLFLFVQGPHRVFASCPEYLTMEIRNETGQHSGPLPVLVGQASPPQNGVQVLEVGEPLGLFHEYKELPRVFHGDEPVGRLPHHIRGPHVLGHVVVVGLGQEQDLGPVGIVIMAESGMKEGLHDQPDRFQDRFEAAAA